MTTPSPINIILFNFQADLPDLDRSLPLIILGISGIAAGPVSIGLPETLFTPMPQTVEEAETWDEDYACLV